MNQNERPENFQMLIQGGMLEALGINMYTSLGKCLVEFVANAYDSNSPDVRISIPFDRIAEARQKLRAAQKLKQKEKGGQAEQKGPAAVDTPVSADGAVTEKVLNVPTAEPISPPIALPDVSVFEETLGPDVSIIISDTGHGMSPADVASKFLPINRRRRASANGAETVLMSEGNKRHVMGRKGLGKLAGFGTAQRITISTKRAGETFRTIFKLDARELRVAENLTEIKIPASYEEGAPVDEHGTTITLLDLKPDAVKSSAEKINQTLAEAFFGIKPEEFAITLNGDPVQETGVEYEFIFPEDASKTGDLVTDYVAIPDLGSLKIRYAVKFRKRGQHLSAGRRGARIYCNGRLAAGPSLFKLPTGMHNFHAQDYMEGIFVADDIDRLGIDFVNTNRTQLREDNDVVDAVIQHISDIMKAAISRHAAFKEGKVEEEIRETETGKMMTRIINNLPTKTRGPASKLLKTIAGRYGAESVEFNQLAPLVVQSMNAGEVLIRLIELQSDPGTIQRITSELSELAEIEKSDSLKLYRGRRNGIIALRKLIEKGESLWREKGIEGELQNLFKSDPWLIKPEYSNYVTSDENLNKLASKIAKILNVDKYSPITNVDGSYDKERPDLVFLMSDSASPHVFTIVELKSPTLPLEFDHLTQLKKYMGKVEDFISTELKKPATVNGYLIGSMPDSNPKKQSEEQRLLLNEMKKREPSAEWEVIGLEELLARAQAIHSDAIKAFEAHLHESASDGSITVDSAMAGGVATSPSVPAASTAVGQGAALQSGAMAVNGSRPPKAAAPTQGKGQQKKGRRGRHGARR